MVGAIVDALDAAAGRALGDQAGRSGAPPVKWLILGVLGDVTSASSAELAQALGVRDDLGSTIRRCRCHDARGVRPVPGGRGPRWAASTATWVRLVIPSFASTWDT